MTPSSKLHNRPLIWQFLLGIIPRYLTVRLHTQEQLSEQWSVVEKAARLILSISSNHDATQYLYALHLIQTGTATFRIPWTFSNCNNQYLSAGQLSLMNDSQDAEITSGDPDSDTASISLIRNILKLLKSLKLIDQYFIVHEFLNLFSSIEKSEVIVQKILAKISQEDTSLARKLHSKEVKKVLQHHVRTCFAKALPTCCFGRVLDSLIAKRDTSCLVLVGSEVVLKNAVIMRSSDPTDIAEEIKSTILVTQPHQSCLSNFTAKNY